MNAVFGLCIVQIVNSASYDNGSVHQICRKYQRRILLTSISSEDLVDISVLGVLN